MERNKSDRSLQLKLKQQKSFSVGIIHFRITVLKCQKLYLLFPKFKNQTFFFNLLKIIELFYYLQKVMQKNNVELSAISSLAFKYLLCISIPLSMVLIESSGKIIALASFKIPYLHIFPIWNLLDSILPSGYASQQTPG